ncbi:MAG: tyrosine-protein phosphatase [Dehalococcoidales bacterium]
MTEKFDRHLRFKSVTNFRDLGGYRTGNGKSMPWRRIFRSGEFARINRDDCRRITEEIKLAAILDLRSEFEVKRQGIGLPIADGIKYYNIAFIPDGGKTDAEEQRYKSFTNMGQFYLDITRDKGFGGRIVQALEVIAEPKNHPLVFHCAIGKDRTGILAAMLLSVLGVAEKDIIEDYSLSGPYMEEILAVLRNDPKFVEGAQALPAYFWKAAPESMTEFLTTLCRDYGSISDYLKAMGAEKSLTKRLEKALLG